MVLTLLRHVIVQTYKIPSLCAVFLTFSTTYDSKVSFKIPQNHSNPFFLRKTYKHWASIFHYHGKCEKSNRKTKPKRNLKEAVNCCEFHNYDCQKMFLCVTYQGMFSYFWYLPQMNTQLRLKKCWTYIAKIRPCSFRVSHFFFITKQPTLCKYLNQSNITLIIEHNLARI